MSVRAKFQVSKIEDSVWDAGTEREKKIRTVHLSPAYADSPENKAFFAATPSGTIQLGCANLAAAEQFEQGKAYYVDFTPADKE